MSACALCSHRSHSFYCVVDHALVQASPFVQTAHFLADRTNGRAYATVLRLSVCL